MTRRHVEPLARQIIAAASVSDELGVHQYTMWEFPCPGCDRMLWGWTRGHVQPPPCPFSCPCGARGEMAPAQAVNIEHMTAEIRDGGAPC